MHFLEGGSCCCSLIGRGMRGTELYGGVFGYNIAFLFPYRSGDAWD